MLTLCSVDGPISRNLSALLEISLSMLVKFGAVIVFSPIFTLPGIVAFLIGGWAGQMYIKAQLSVKREMSNARSPVLSHFGAAIAGIGGSSNFGGSVFRYLLSHSFYPRILCPGHVQTGVARSYRQILATRKDILQLEQVDFHPYRRHWCSLLVRLGCVSRLRDWCYSSPRLRRGNRFLLEHGRWLQQHDLVVGPNSERVRGQRKQVGVPQ